ncbi:MAG: CRISPR system precrRNA processing endoribonuclease RAMP protein Cas6 [Candidatus Acididesulfobacter guangdongensis]|uniref:CRISPR system precrRNA processing endoribonuclease RAMP protein Cas6 n=1 Tax=Acididesulfobacter guangdongensis TaxID=2597225 RepID=A0A519BFW5_ACIG2|nr:MAG: CRISPR system precrRNA processing endoribonuclease RAMP protein Cas6 [Candidatus Acididesulfobacter guangdongensis]
MNEKISAILNDFKIAKLNFEIKTENDTLLPDYKGSTFRGVFGHIFKDVMCISYENECETCNFKSVCMFKKIFDSPPPSNSSRLKNYSSLPHPYIIEPPLETKNFYKKNEIIKFSLILIGQAISLFPYFAYSFGLAGRRGIGKMKQGKFSLFNIINDKNKEKLYDFKKEELLPLRNYYTVKDFIEKTKDCCCTGNSGIAKDSGSNVLKQFVPYDTIGLKTDRTAISAENNNNQLYKCSNISKKEIFSVNLDFITPTKIIFNEKIVQNLEFHVYIRNLLRRISNLNFFHCVNSDNKKNEINDNPDNNIDFNYYIEKAYGVRANNNLKWKSVDRYSNRQKRHMKISGFTGKISFENVGQEFLWIIRVGEIIHLGKNTTFGNGKYEIDSII